MKASFLQGIKHVCPTHQLNQPNPAHVISWEFLNLTRVRLTNPPTRAEPTQPFILFVDGF